jgi:hypothetical protein
MPHVTGGTRLRVKRGPRAAASLADAPAHVLAQLPKETPDCLRPERLPKYPPGDPRNGARQHVTVVTTDDGTIAVVHGDVAPTAEDRAAMKCIVEAAGKLMKGAYPKAKRAR